MRRSFVLSAVLLLAAAYAAWAEPITLTLRPEAGLQVAYDLEAEGKVVIRGADGSQATVEFSMTARRVDTVKEVTEDRVVVERSLAKIVLKQAGRTVPLPGESTVRETVTFDAQGVLQPRKDSPVDKLPQEVQEVLNLLEVVPFAPEPVEIGDRWDASGAEETPAEIKITKSLSEAQLIETYASDDMQVALIQQMVDSAVTGPAPEGLPSKGTRSTMVAKVLQSNRIDDGCLLGVKGSLSTVTEILDNGGKPVVTKTDQLEATLRVAAQ